ncbi:MAG: hypothetical protein IJP31_04615 [Lachnospiraceae bacterium]|nr:hypothetical protein [Lachnospiraceae bacterium]
MALAKNYTSLLDEVYRSASVTADLTSDAGMSRAGANANEIIYPQISVTGLGEYDRNAGYTSASVDLKWKTAAFNYDRGAKITVDVMDNEESRNLAFGMAGATLMREKVAPEADAFTFATLAALDNISKATGEIDDATQFLDALLAAWSKMDEDEVPQEGRMLYATATLLNSVMALDTTKSREILSRFDVKKVVPQARFYTAIDLLDGKTVDEEAGHYKKADTGQDISFMIIHKPAIIKFDKHVASNIIPASANPDADADIVKYRKYGMVNGYENKRAGIYLHSKA